MTRYDFFQQILGSGWCAYEVTPTWIRISRQPDYSSLRDGSIDPMAPIEVIMTRECQINLLLPTRFLTLCPGRPGQLRYFRIIASDWADCWGVIHELYREFYTRKQPFDDVVILTIPATRLVPDDYTFFLQHRGDPPYEWRLVKLNSGDSI